MELIIEHKYKKSDFGINGIVNFWSEITVEGELLTFFAENSRYQNELMNDGFVYECRGKYGLIPNGKTADLHRHILLKKKNDKDYTYLGKGLYETRYNEKCNKIFLKGEKK